MYIEEIISKKYIQFILLSLIICILVFVFVIMELPVITIEDTKPINVLRY